ncbi:hypothetical protein G3I77_19295 [Streptomyces sp. D2-8]|uniref:hypothetical protein n=1 Tax=Streptomyces sp. D2-8 TaxID=2707767 RepID=UPI0020BD4DD1|nr:hypothetical protein [Streptomyces sp. D2-8]MCK8435088.1 hypothetical protein [Streptomyces sp. D2-8]
MKVDFGEKVGVSRIEGDKIITENTEYKDRKSVVRMRICLKWNFDCTECLHWKEAEEQEGAIACLQPKRSPYTGS